MNDTQHHGFLLYAAVDPCWSLRIIKFDARHRTRLVKKLKRPKEWRPYLTPRPQRRAPALPSVCNLTCGLLRLDVTKVALFDPHAAAVGGHAHPQTRDIPIIGISAYALDSEREQAIATGCDEFDAKPIEFESLVATIRRVLANPR